MPFAVYSISSASLFSLLSNYHFLSAPLSETWRRRIGQEHQPVIRHRGYFPCFLCRRKWPFEARPGGRSKIKRINQWKRRCDIRTQSRSPIPLKSGLTSQHGRMGDNRLSSPFTANSLNPFQALLRLFSATEEVNFPNVSDEGIHLRPQRALLMLPPPSFSWPFQKTISPLIDIERMSLGELIPKTLGPEWSLDKVNPPFSSFFPRGIWRRGS